MTSGEKLLTDGGNPREHIVDVRWMIITLIVLVSMAYLTMFVEAYQGENQMVFSPFEIVLLITLGVVYTFLVMYPEWIVDVFPQTAGRWAYFILIYGLILLIGWLAEMNGQIWLLILPPIGTAAEYSLKWMVGISLVGMVITILGIFLVFGTWNWGVTLFISPAVFFVAAFSYISERERETRQRIENLALELRDANHKLSEYAAKIEELAVVRERNRMAREIHDSLGHYLTVVNVQIGAAKAVMNQDVTKASEALDKAQRLTQEGLGEVRQSVAVLREGRETRPLIETIPELIQMTQTAGIETTFTLLGEVPADIPVKVNQTIYRVVQEGLTNIRKHSEASESEVVLDFTGSESVNLTIRDNGLGSEDVSGGFGLIGMSERVQLLGGDIKIKTTPHKGLTLEIRLPLTTPENEFRSQYE
ncbi:MAG: sensor histidine kinase [Ardenticatenaceae bacterium]|nr:sensor histidine kinase [Ardenticatenaceae bacterium]